MCFKLLSCVHFIVLRANYFSNKIPFEQNTFRTKLSFEQTVWWSGPDNDIANLARLCKQYPSILLLADKQAYTLCGAESLLGPAFEEGQLSIHYIDTYLPELTYLQTLLETVPVDESQLIVAVGGGTTIDIAKLVRFHIAGHALAGIPASQKAGRTIPLVAVPTTNGSGSEATHFAVLYIGSEKSSIAHDSLLPDYVYLNPAFLGSLPAYQKAATGLDALSQGIESYWSVHATAASQEFSRKAISNAWTYLERHVNAPDFEAANGMMLAAYMAGKAINLTKTTICHALSYTLTSRFGVPHGIAVALTLGAALEFNAAVTGKDSLDPRGAGYTQGAIREIVELLGCHSASEARASINHLMDSIVGGHQLERFGVQPENGIEQIIENVNRERLINNPRQVTEEALRRLFAR